MEKIQKLTYYLNVLIFVPSFFSEVNILWQKTRHKDKNTSFNDNSTPHREKSKQLDDKSTFHLDKSTSQHDQSIAFYTIIQL